MFPFTDNTIFKFIDLLTVIITKYQPKMLHLMIKNVNFKIYTATQMKYF